MVDTDILKKTTERHIIKVTSHKPFQSVKPQAKILNLNFFFRFLFNKYKSTIVTITIIEIVVFDVFNPP